MVNFFQTAEIDESLQPVMPDVFNQLLSLLERGTNFVKGNALEAMTLLARALEEDFEPVSRSSARAKGRKLTRCTRTVLPGYLPSTSQPT